MTTRAARENHLISRKSSDPEKIIGKGLKEWERKKRRRWSKERNEGKKVRRSKKKKKEANEEEEEQEHDAGISKNDQKEMRYTGERKERNEKKPKDR